MTEQKKEILWFLVRKKPFFFLDYLLTCFRQNYDPDLHSEYEESEGYFGIPPKSSLMRKRVIKSLTISAEEVVPVRTNKWYPSVGQSAPPDLTHVKVLFLLFLVAVCVFVFLLFLLQPTRSDPCQCTFCWFCFCPQPN